jgi:hypothetical protein
MHAWSARTERPPLAGRAGANTEGGHHRPEGGEPGHACHWLNVKLVGKKTQRAAIGTRVKVVTARESPVAVRVFRGIAVDQPIEVTEFGESYRPLKWKALP